MEGSGESRGRRNLANLAVRILPEYISNSSFSLYPSSVCVLNHWFFGFADLVCSGMRAGSVRLGSVLILREYIQRRRLLRDIRRHHRRKACI